MLVIQGNFIASAATHNDQVVDRTRWASRLASLMDDLRLTSAPDQFLTGLHQGRDVDLIGCQTRRQQAQANSLNFRSLALPRRKSSIGIGSVQVRHSPSVMLPSLLPKIKSTGQQPRA